MSRDCENIQKLLGAWLDRELSASEATDLQRHVEGCASCAAEKARLERLDSSLKNVLETEASRIAFEPFFAGVRQRIEEEKSWPRRIADWTRVVLSPPRLAWAVPTTVVVLVAALSVEQFFPGWRSWFGETNMTAVESIDGHGFNVALLREAKTKTTVIWLFENQETEDEAAVEPVSGEQAY